MRFMRLDGRLGDADEHRRVRRAARVMAHADLRLAGERRQREGGQQRSNSEDQAGAERGAAEEW
jgi:hypothetical protein